MKPDETLKSLLAGMTEEGWVSSILNRFIKEKTPSKSSQSEHTNKQFDEKFNLFHSRIEDNEIVSNQTLVYQDKQYLWNKKNFVKNIAIGSGAATLTPPVPKQPSTNIIMDAKMKRELVEKDSSQEELVPHSRKLSRSLSVTNESKLLNMIGLPNRKPSVRKLPRPASAFSRLSTQSHPFTRTPVLSSTHPQASYTPSFTLPAQIEKNESQKVQIECKRRHSQPLLLRRPKSGPSSGPRTIRHSIARPSQVITPMEPQARSSNGRSSSTPSKKAFKISNVSPIYERSRAAPTPFSTDSSTPIWEIDGEKKVRFLESEVVGEAGSRPSSAVSTYSNILKNSTRFSFTSNEARDIYGIIGHTPKICNCPCHFFPKRKQNIGVQVLKSDLDSLRPPRPPPRPRHYRLFVIPTLAGLGNLSLGSKFTTYSVRALLSQVGLGLVIVMWWFIGALIFSTIEGPLQHGHLERMSSIRANLVIDLATELRQVKPYDSIWRNKIEEYMIRLETAVLLAVKSGYSSNTVKWSIPESLLYSFSLTSLLGPGGLFVQSPLTRIFSLLYSLVGIPIFFLFLFNVAQTLREGLTWIWIWRRRRKRVDAVSAIQAEENTNSRTNLNTIEVGASYNERPTSSRDFAQLIHISKVQALDSNFSNSRRSSSVSLNVRYETVPQTSAINVGASSSTSNNLELSSSSAQPTNNPIQSELSNSFNLPMPTILQRSDISLYQRRPYKESVPWLLLAIFPTFYLITGFVILVTTQNWSVISALFVIGNNLLFIDHGGLDNKSLFNSGTGTITYMISVLLGVIISVTFLLGIWPKIKSALGEAGRNLYVVKPVCLSG